MKIGFVIPASMQISGNTSGVNRQANSYFRALEKLEIECHFINHNIGVYGFSHIIIFNIRQKLTF